MGIFWQHVGDANSRRDFPKTLGDPKAGVKRYSIDHIERYIRVESPINEASVRRSFESIGSTTFQIWGFPTGAASVLSKAERGDLFLFLDTATEYGAFRYAGRLLFLIPENQWELSTALWSESKYPLIGLFRGNLINYPWTMFLKDFGYGLGLKPMGRTYRASTEAQIRAAPQGEIAFEEALHTHYPAQTA